MIVDCMKRLIRSVRAEGAGPGQSTGFPCPLQYMYMYSGGQKSCPQVDFSVIFNKMAQQAVHLSFSRADTKFRGEYSKIFPKSIFSVSLSLSVAMCGRTSLLANIAQSTIRGVESTISHLNCSNPYRN